MSKKLRIVIVGGGFGGLFTAINLTGSGDVTLITNEDHFTFTPLLYEYLSREVEAWHIAPLYKELLDREVKFIRGQATAVDFARREITVDTRSVPTAYDVLVIAVGGVTNYAGVEGAAEHSIPFRKVAHADALRARMIKVLDGVPPDAAPQNARQAVTFAVVGAGASGVELATKMGDLLNKGFAERGLQGSPRVVVFEYGDRVVPNMGEELRSHVAGALHRSGVEVHTLTKVQRIMPTSLTYEHDGKQSTLEAAGVVWTGGVQVSPLIKRLDVEKERRDLIIVEPTLQVRGHNEVFALGDIVYYPDVPGPLAGTAQLANQQAGLVADNVRALLAGKPLRTKRFVELGEAVSLGTENAAVLVGGQVIEGALARQARFALYTGRLPTWHHRLKVGASWFFEGMMPQPLSLRSLPFNTL